VGNFKNLKMLRIIIGDDHPVFRRGTRDVLLEMLSVVEIGEAGTGTELVSLVKQRTWDVCIMDASMPEKSGTELLREILNVRPLMPVLVFSMYPEKMYAVRMIRSGASGYLNKASTSPDLLLEAIRTVLGGRQFLTPSVAECLADTLRTRSGTSLTPDQFLSDREFQIFEMIAVGKQIKEIANDLCVSPVTISTYRARILRKLGLKSNADLVRYALEHALIV
jgi:DNA-binding NarL/FixJ family response regulator